MIPLHRNAVPALICWSQFQPPVRLMIQPELQSTEFSDDGSTIHQVTPDDHPFWFIHRTESQPRTRAPLSKPYRRWTLMPNAQIVQQRCIYEKIPPSSWGILDADKLLDTINTFTVSLPFIVNTRRIQAGKEVILKLVPPPNPQPCDRSRANTEVGQIMMEGSRKRQRTD